MRVRGGDCGGGARGGGAGARLVGEALIDLADSPELRQRLGAGRARRDTRANVVSLSRRAVGPPTRRWWPAIHPPSLVLQPDGRIRARGTLRALGRGTVCGWRSPARVSSCPGLRPGRTRMRNACPSRPDAPQPPPPSLTGGSLSNLQSWAIREVAGRPGRMRIAGHSMGAALAVLVAVTVPEQVEELLLIAPAGLPLKQARLAKCDRSRPADCSGHAIARPTSSRAHATSRRDPRSTCPPALRRLDLSAQMRKVKTLGISTTVIGCTTDTLSHAGALPASRRAARRHLPGARPPRRAHLDARSPAGAGGAARGPSSALAAASYRSSFIVVFGFFFAYFLVTKRPVAASR